MVFFGITPLNFLCDKQLFILMLEITSESQGKINNQIMFPMTPILQNTHNLFPLSYFFS